MQFNVCVIGCGDMGRQHAAVWSAREDARVVSVADPLEDRRTHLAQSAGAVAYASNEDAILHDGVNVVSICTPVCFHSEIGCFAAKHGRHVLCEKPLTLTLEQADAVIACAKENGVCLSTSLQYRGFPRCVRYHEMFKEGAFGGPIFVRFADVREVRPKIAMHRQSMNGGPIVDMAGHYFDVMRYITGEEPVRVYAQGHILGAGKQRLAGIDDLAIDAATIDVTMTGGHVLSVFVNWGMPEGYAGYGDEFIAGPALSVRPVGGKLEVLSAGSTELIELGLALPGPTVRVNSLVAAIRGEGPIEVSGEDGRVALRVSLAALESIGSNSVVEL